MRSNTTFLLSAVLLLPFCSAPAGADGLDYDAREAHATADTNDDGYVDRQEFQVRMVEVFYHADVNKDGGLEMSELQTIEEGMVHAPADDDKDGKLRVSEYVDHRFGGFDSADKNKDSKLSVEEVVQAYESP